MPAPSFSAESLKGRRVFPLLEVTFGTAGAFRVSTEPIDVPGTNGVRFDGGLSDFRFSDEVDLFGLSETNRSISVAALFALDIAQLVARGFDLTTARGSLSLFVDGTNYEDRRVLISDAVLQDPEFGESFEPLRFSLRSNFFDSAAIVPPADSVVNSTTWPDHDESIRGAAYPWIFGRPGRTSGVGSRFGSEALRVKTDAGGFDHWLIAGHRVTAGTVQIGTKSAPGTLTGALTVKHQADGLGRVVAYVDADPGTLTIGDDEEFYVKWLSGGGRPRLTGSDAMTGAGDILQFLLQYAPDVQIDAGRMAAAVDQLNAIKLDFVIEEHVEIWRFVREHILKFAPASLASSGSGMFPIVWERDLTKERAALTVDAERDDWERTSAVSSDFLDRKPINVFNIRHSKNMQRGRFESISRLDGTKNKSSAYARASVARYKPNEKTEESIAIYDDAAAFQIMTWWARIYGFPIRSVEYTAPIDFGFLLAGSVILFSDARLHIFEQLAIVQAIEWSDDRIIGVRLSWCEDLPRDDRAV